MEWPADLGETGWRLLSAEDRHAEAPDAFWIPSREERENLRYGNGAKLLFDVADQAEGVLVAQVERMWVVVTEVTAAGYVGVLANIPRSSHSAVQRGSRIAFAAEHVCDIDEGPPPAELEKLLQEADHFANPS